MDLEKTDVRRRLQDYAVVLGLEAKAGARRQGRVGAGGRRVQHWRPPKIDAGE
jgi:hypothetical protein